MIYIAILITKNRNNSYLMKNQTLKKQILKDIERKVQEKTSFEAKYDENKKKYFLTFPYPYMNGTLHLGHAYTLIKADLLARYMRLQGYNVLFPFAFHGTGMPIYACANKLAHELTMHQETSTWSELDKTSQIKILMDMGIKKDEISKFTDPYYWLEYFPKVAIKDLIAFGISADFSRSFITTDINPYYDSFVKWQFTKLDEKKLLTSGKRYVIYSEKDKQPCADHDRAIGEGVEPVEYPTTIVTDFHTLNITFLAIVCPSSINATQSVYYNPTLEYSICTYQNQKYVMSTKSANNLRHQLTDFEINDKFKIETNLSWNKTDCSIGTGIYLSDKTFEHPIDIKKMNIKSTSLALRYFEPASKVVSRSGDICKVALTNQWFINYGDQELKQRVNKYLNDNFKKTDPQVVNGLKHSSNWIKEWPFSRNYGIGTKYNGFLIDSLSDSTIYMVYYTIAHLIEKITKEKVNIELWNHIFFGTQLDESKYTDIDLEIINNMKKEFSYWYPLDNRVSGKDLISNHLTMCLYNHIAIFGEDKCPKDYLVGGYMILNGKKMSKSTGNFKTIKQTVDDYGCDVTRLTLIDCCINGMDDADFNEKFTDGILLKMYGEYVWNKEIIEQICNGTIGDKINDFFDDAFSFGITECFDKAKQGYESFDYRKALYEGYYNILNERNRYRVLFNTKCIKPSKKVLLTYLEQSLLILYPICPHLVEDLWIFAESKGINFSKFWINDLVKIDGYAKCKYIYCEFIKFVDNMNSMIDKLLKKKTEIKGFNVVLYKKYTEDEIKIINLVRQNKDYIIEIKKIYSKNELADSAKFGAFVADKIMNHDMIWFDEIDNMNKFVIEWLPKMFSYPITFEQSDCSVTFKSNPSSPKINII